MATKENSKSTSTDDQISKRKLAYKKYIRFFWGIVASIILGVFILFYLISVGVLGYIPSASELENPSNKYASQLFTSDNQEFGSFNLAGENRTYATFDELSENLVNALIATEDKRFYEHAGIDYESLMRVMVKTLILRRNNAGGGSTISQQTAKLFYTMGSKNTSGRSFQKLNEWVIAVHLERHFTKEEIMTLYFNKFDFLYNAVGINTAAKVYFNTTPKELNLEQSALLVGMCKNPSFYNPIRHPERTMKRREVVLKQMLKAEYIDQNTYDSVRLLPLGIDYQKVDHTSGMAPYLRSYIKTSMMATKPSPENYSRWASENYYRDSIRWVKDPLYGWCQKNRKSDGSPYNVYTDGLRIYSTINSKMQRYAEEAMKEHLGTDLQPKFFREKKGQKNAPYSHNTSVKEKDKKIWAAAKQTDLYRELKEEGKKEEEIKKIFMEKRKMKIFTWEGDVDTLISPWNAIVHNKHFLRASFLSKDPITGHVKAYVGGPDFNFFQYDMITQGKRQVGSTFKPIVYAIAMQNGFSPCDKVPNVPHTVYTEDGRPWTPKNSTKSRYGEMVSLRWGLANSNNYITAWVMSQIKQPQTVVNMAHSLGITSKLDPVVSLCLGPCEISLEEMVNTYSVFADNGIYTSPVVVYRIEDSKGHVLASFNTEKREVLSTHSAYLMTDMLQGVVKEGSAIRLRSKYKLNGSIGGKTGTTQDHSDGWFIGISPRLVSGAWVGGEERDIHFNSIREGQGASMALPIWALYMKKVYDDKDLGYSLDDKFTPPPGFNIDLDCSKTTTEEDPDEFMLF